MNQSERIRYKSVRFLALFGNIMNMRMSVEVTSQQVAHLLSKHSFFAQKSVL